MAGQEEFESPPFFLTGRRTADYATAQLFPILFTDSNTARLAFVAGSGTLFLQRELEEPPEKEHHATKFTQKSTRTPQR